ncbi:hypothetical protein H9L39_00979 [Fusarium oxysporum f. sp. albedinis]|nr:hypothetical protein H9L39_00979 [Fusarium oxysporum f. sp. albedinis]
MLYALYMAWSLIHIYQYQHTELQGDIAELLFGWFQRPELWNLAETLEAIVHCFGQIAIGSVDKFLVHRYLSSTREISRISLISVRSH